MYACLCACICVYLCMFVYASLSLSLFVCVQATEMGANVVKRAGFLSKKNDTLAGGARSQLRGWRQYWVELVGNRLLFYSDNPAMTASGASNAAARPSPVGALSLRDAVLSFDYTKAKHVLVLSLADRGRYMLRAANEDDLKEWVRALEQTAAATPSYIHSTLGHPPMPVAHHPYTHEHTMMRPAARLIHTRTYSLCLSLSLSLSFSFSLSLAPCCGARAGLHRPRGPGQRPDAGNAADSW
jgi:hypothetical protein